MQLSGVNPRLLKISGQRIFLMVRKLAGIESRPFYKLQLVSRELVNSQGAMRMGH
jgi:hypothetical protein